MRRSLLPVPLLLLVLASASLAQNPPTVVETVPANGAEDVRGPEVALVVRFSEPMKDGSWSLVGTDRGEPPEVVGEPRYADSKTLHVTLRVEPGKSYGLGFNSATRKGFVSADGSRPLAPFVLAFRTADSFATDDAKRLVGTWLHRTSELGFRLTIRADGTYENVVTTNDGDTTVKGRWTLEGDRLVVRPADDEPEAFDLRFTSDDVLVVTDEDGSSFEFRRLGADDDPPPPSEEDSTTKRLKIGLPLAPRAGGSIVHTRYLPKKLSAGGLTMDGAFPELWVMNAEGGDRKPFLRSSDPFASAREARWSHDGRRLVFASDHDRVRSACIQDIFVVNADGSGLRRVTGNELVGPAPIGYGAVTGIIVDNMRGHGEVGKSASQIWVTAQGANAWVHPADATTMDIVNKETGQRLTKVRAYRFTLPRVAAGSKVWLRVWANNQVGNLVVLGVKAGVVNDAGNFDLSKGNYYASKPSLTPDGKYVVGQGGIMSVAESESPIVPGQMTSVVGGADNICVYDLATGAVVAMFEPTRVKGENACFPVVAPGGRRVALCWGPACMESLAIVSFADLLASRPRPQVLYQGQRHLMQATLEATSTPAWSPDGRVVAFARSYMTTTTVSSNLAIIGADGSGARQLTNFGVDTICTAPCFSPDGRRIAFTVLTGKHGPIKPEHLALLQFTADIWVIGADGSGLTRLTDDGISCEPAWCR